MRVTTTSGRRPRCLARSIVVVVAIAVLFGSCRITPVSSLRALASDAPTPSSVLVTGGAFLARSPAEAPVLEHTFMRSVDPNESPEEAARAAEGISLDRVVDALRIARTFTRVAVDTRDRAARAAYALANDGRAVPLEDRDVRDFLAKAAADGHDYLLVLDTLADGPVQELGINSRWPITAIAWFVLGVGMVIPDHTFESVAELRVSMRDVHTGEIVYQRVFDGDPIDLSLIDRTDFWGLVTSIVVPPFWVGNDEERVLAQVRAATLDRLMYLLAQDLKSAACRNRLSARAPAEIDVRSEGGMLRVRIRALEGLSRLRLEIDGERYRGRSGAWESFTQRLLDTAVTEADGGEVYEGLFEEPVAGNYVRILAQTVGGRVASSTIELPRAATGAESR